MSFDSEFYERLRATATRLLTARGWFVTLTHYGASSPNHATGGVTASETIASVAGVLTAYTEKKTGASFSADNTMTQVDERRLVVSAEAIDGATLDVTGVLGFEPVAGDLATLGGNVWRIIECKPTNPAGIAVSFELRVRRG